MLRPQSSPDLGGARSPSRGRLPSRGMLSPARRPGSSSPSPRRPRSSSHPRSPKRRRAAEADPRSAGEIALAQVQDGIAALIAKSCADLSENVGQDGTVDGADVADALEDLLEILSHDVVQKKERESMAAVALSGILRPPPSKQVPAEAPEGEGEASGAPAEGTASKRDSFASQGLQEAAMVKAAEVTGADMYEPWTVESFRAWATDQVVPLAARAAAQQCRDEAEALRAGISIDRDWAGALAAYERAQVLHPTTQTYKEMAHVGQFCGAAKKQREKLLRKAGDAGRHDLAAFLYADGRDQEAVPHIGQLGFKCRMSPKMWIAQDGAKLGTEGKGPCNVAAVFDRALNDTLVHGLQNAFSPSAPYWTHHEYDVYAGMSTYGYFSHCFKLYQHASYGMIGQLAKRMHKLAFDAGLPGIDPDDAMFCEVWAHCKPPASGHQLHFDTDNEGRDGPPKHPIFTGVCYLTEHGGPTIVTTQTAKDEKLADLAYLAWPGRNRVGIFKGDVIHGVLPARHASRGFRCSVMMAFWGNVRVREESYPGACRPLRMDEPWAATIAHPVDDSYDRGATKVEPGEVSPVWLPVVTVDEPKPNKDRVKSKLPAYDRCFQGF